MAYIVTIFFINAVFFFYV